MPGIAVSNLEDRRFVESICDVLQKFVPENIILRSVEHIYHVEQGQRILRFYYSRVSEGIASRQAGKPDDKIPKYPVEISVPIWNTHIDTDQILAKFALVR